MGQLFKLGKKDIDLNHIKQSLSSGNQALTVERNCAWVRPDFK